ncbi:MAG: hypothetical protein ACXVNR_01735, partial [Bacteroidia bacterium]
MHDKFAPNAPNDPAIAVKRASQYAEVCEYRIASISFCAKANCTEINKARGKIFFIIIQNTIQRRKPNVEGKYFYLPRCVPTPLPLLLPPLLIP